MYVAMNQKWAIEHIQLCQQGRYPANIVRIDSLFHTIIYKRWAAKFKMHQRTRSYGNFFFQGEQQR